MERSHPPPHADAGVERAASCASDRISCARRPTHALSLRGTADNRRLVPRRAAGTGALHSAAAVAATAGALTTGWLEHARRLGGGDMGGPCVGDGGGARGVGEFAVAHGDAVRARRCRGLGQRRVPQQDQPVGHARTHARAHVRRLHPGRDGGPALGRGRVRSGGRGGGRADLGSVGRRAVRDSGSRRLSSPSPRSSRYDADWSRSRPRIRRGRCRARPSARASAPPHPAYHWKPPAPTHRTIRHPVCAPTIWKRPCGRPHCVPRTPMEHRVRGLPRPKSRH
jgi:hypothetical protein